MLRSSAVFVFVIVFASVAFAVGGGGGGDDQQPISDGKNVSTADGLPDVWVADVFYRALSNFTVAEDVGTTACRKQTQTYVWHLRNNSYWAVKMYDSWSRYPNGILTGSTHQMGVYNECIDVHQPVQGKYCMTEVKLSAAANSSFKLQTKDEVENFDHAWNEILAFVFHGDQYRRNVVRIGICIPESCTAENLEISLQKALDGVFSPHRVQTQVKVEPIMCSTDKRVFPRETGFIVTTTLIVLVLAACVLSTLAHLIVITRNKDEDGKKSRIPDWVYWFSIIRNGTELIRYDKNSELNIFNGIKAVVMVMVQFGHYYFFFTMIPMWHTMNIEAVYKIGPDVILSGMNLVDPFFYIAGYLIYVTVKPRFAKSGTSWMTVLHIVFVKYLRFMPPYGAVILMVTYFVPQINIGPLWAAKTLPEAEKCKNYWWANVLAVSNFLDIDKQCLVVGWYISCLIQFYVIGHAVVYVCAKRRKLGVIALSLLLCVSLVVPFCMTYTARAYGIVRLNLAFLEKMSSSYEFQHFYGPFYMRGIPFFAGLLAGVVVEELKNSKFKMSKLTVYIWTTIVATACVFLQNYGAVFYQRHRAYNVIEQATYAVLTHCTWPILLFWITICHFTSGYGPIVKLFNNNFMSILNNLGYSVYLINITVIMIIANRQSISVIPTSEKAIDDWIICVVKSYGAGLLLHLFVEAPFKTIITSVLFGNKNKATKENHPEIAKTEDSKIENDSRM